MKTQMIKVCTLMLLFTTITLPLLAQDGFGDPLADVPVDGGLSLLVAAGVGYGAKKLKDKRKKK